MARFAKFVAIAGWLALDILVFPRLLGAAGGLTLAPRMLIAALVVPALLYLLALGLLRRESAW